MSRIAVLVTTSHRGVFFGYCEEEEVNADIIELHDAQLAIYWSADVRGFMGLASSGPTAGCRIGPPAHIRIRSVTSVLSVTPEAEAAWKAKPWAK